MAAFPLSCAIHSNALASGATDCTKTKAAPCCHYGKKVKHNLGKMDVMVHVEAPKNRTKYSCWYRSLKMRAMLGNSIVRTEEQSSSYLFRTEFGDQVKVVVRKTSTKYGVSVDVSSLKLHSSSLDELVMCWGIFRSDSSCFMPLDYQNLAPHVKARTTETLFQKTSSGKFAVELDFDVNLFPFYLSFILKFLPNVKSENSEIRSHRNTRFCVPVGLNSGYPAPLGVSFSADGSVNFALFSRTAKSVVLCFYDDTTTDKPALEIDLDPYTNRSGDVWHVSLNSALPFVGYGFRCKQEKQKIANKSYAERVLLDPYAKLIAKSVGPSSHPTYLGQLYKEPAFDWGGDVRPSLALEKLLVYRLNVTRFTEDKSSKLGKELAGSFSGVSAKLQHFKDLGVNAILLEPIFPFDEKKGPYFPYHFFSLDNVYGDPLSSINSLKEMVKKLHAEGIEVFLEVVFTYAGEGAGLRELDDPSYYIASKDADLRKRNALNCNFPVFQQLILDSLRHWVIEYRIDGFCFVNASYLLRGTQGEVLSRPPLVEAIAFDPILSKTKIIADFWDPHDKATKEVVFPHWKRWAEINTKFCNDVRNFLRGEGLLSDLATRLCGSGDIFSSGRGPAFSFNFIARSFGLPLVDLVSFSSSEVASELSWNCGEEGPTNKPVVLERRLKQIRNFLFILFISFGVPVINMGDECGQSSRGSPAYSDRKPFDWNALKTGFGVQTTQFISFLSSLRVRRSDLLQKRSFLRAERIDWHGRDQSPPRWEDPTSQFVAMTLKVDEEDAKLSSASSNSPGDLFVALNAADRSETVILPPPPVGMEWLRLVDTALPFPGFFSEDGDPVLEQIAGLITYEMKSHSCVLFESKSTSG